MDINADGSRFWTEQVDDRNKGFAGVEVYRELSGGTVLVAKVLYWDATGGFSVETVKGDVPAKVIEAAIKEAKQKVKIA